MRSAMISVSIFWKTAANFGLLDCMRLLLASAMLSASTSISISSALKVIGLLTAILFVLVCLIARLFCVVRLVICLLMIGDSCHAFCDATCVLSGASC